MPWPPLCYACSALAAYIVMFFLPLCKLPLPLFTVAIFPYLRDKEPGKAIDHRLRKFNIIITLPPPALAALTRSCWPRVAMSLDTTPLLTALRNSSSAPW